MQLARCDFVDGTYLLEILLIYPSTQAKLAGPAYLDGLVRKDPTPLLRRQRGTTPLSYVVRGATPFSWGEIAPFSSEKREKTGFIEKGAGSLPASPAGLSLGLVSPPIQD